MKKKISIGSIIVAVVFILIFFNNIVDFIVNIEWFKEVGYSQVYFTHIVAVLKLMVPIFVILFLAIWAYYTSLRKSIVKMKSVVQIKKKSLEKKIFFIANFLISFLISYGVASAYWYTILQFTNSTSFNKKDPLFGLDISFYVFKLPLIDSLYSLFMGVLGFLIIVTIIVYFVLTLTDREGFKAISSLKSGITKFAGRQLAIVSSIIMLMLSLGFQIKAWNLVYSPRGVVFGAGYTDVKVTLMFYRILVVVCIVAAIVMLISIMRAKVKPVVISVIAIVVLVVIESITAVVVQNFIVKSNESALETSYIKNNIDYTREAFNINNIDQQIFEVKNTLKSQDIAANKDILGNIKINSYSQSLEFYNQTQIIRYYYGFNDVDVDRYNINGKFSQVFVAPREISLDALQQKATSWQNKHLAYTHGYGVVMSKVNSVTPEGQPNFVIKDIPPDNATDIPLTNPRIYFGEQTNQYAVVNTNMSEFDYPKGGENQYNKYDGKAGIPMTYANKLLFAINQKEVNFLLSHDITSSSKVLINRNIVNRAKKIAPFLTYDKDPYVVIDDGKLYWILDAYTTSNRYPYSQPQQNVNYIRNSVKVVVDAVDGTTNFYMVDKTDPIVQCYSKIFPELFKDISTVPSGIKAHFRYPEDLFNMQCNVLGKYHVTDTGVFYKEEDLWDIAKNQKKVEGDKTTSSASYVVTKLPNNDKEEMLMFQYFNMKEKNNMVGIFGARMDGDNYGKLVLYKFPPQKNIYSPYMFKQSINQDTTISSELSLWNKDGSEVQFGDTIIIPIKDSLLYVEPLYLRAQGKNSIPEMKRVIVGYGDKIVSAESIDLALQKIFNYTSNTQVPTPTPNGTTTTPQQPATKASAEQIKQAKDLYQKALDAQKAGDWSKYGDYIKQLGDLINEMNK